MIFSKSAANTSKLTFYSGVETVTGANFLFECDGKRILVDCGLLQGTQFSSDENARDFEYDPSTIDYLFVTHAHMDHIGRIPKLVKDGFNGIIFSTPETRALTAVMLPDGLHLMANEARRHGKDPIYTEDHIRAALALWKEIPYHAETQLTPQLSVFLRDAGHILGSSMFEFRRGDKTVVFTGDTGNSPTPLLRNTEALNEPTYLIIDSVYGDRNHEPLEERRHRLKDIINETISRGGTVVIPTFSIERTQVLLYELNNLIESHAIPTVPVFVDSPLATKVTDVYKRSTEYFNQDIQKQIQSGDDIFNFPRLSFTFTSAESQEIEKVKGPKIILAGSGMSSGGRVIHHEKHFLPDAKNTILFVGYQVAGSLGRAILEGQRTVEIDGLDIKIRAHVEVLNGYSAHKDSDHLVTYVHESASKKLKKVFIVMGEPRASLFLAQRIHDELGLPAQVPERGKVYSIDF